MTSGQLCRPRLDCDPNGWPRGLVAIIASPRGSRKHPNCHQNHQAQAKHDGNDDRRDEIGFIHVGNFLVSDCYSDRMIDPQPPALILMIRRPRAPPFVSMAVAATGTPVVAAVACAGARVAVAIPGFARNAAPISAANALRTNEAERVGECREGNIWSLLPRRRHQDYLLIFIYSAQKSRRIRGDIIYNYNYYILNQRNNSLT
jgi:hypothetical protein